MVDQPVDWGAVRSRMNVGAGGVVAAPRHHTPPQQTWQCPSCSATNTSPVADGCPKCQYGAPQPSAIPLPPVKPSPLVDVSPADLAFGKWIQPLRGKVDATQEAYLHAAFLAGVDFGYGYSNTEPGPAPTSTPPPAAVPLQGTARTRTILAALRFFKEGMLAYTPEEIATGEWLSAAATAELITEYEDELAREQANKEPPA